MATGLLSARGAFYAEGNFMSLLKAQFSAGRRAIAVSSSAIFSKLIVPM